MKYILASASPRRAELLTEMGLDFTIMPADTEETITAEKPGEIVTCLAKEKALKVNESLVLADNYCIIGADTIVYYEGEVLGKPEDKDDATSMLLMLQNRTHQVYTGIALCYKKNGQEKLLTFFEKTDVTFYPVDRFDIKAYIESGDPLDKAGSYGIQSGFGKHVRSIKGEYTNVVGLPIGRLYNELLKAKLL
ncbi:septum formation protein [Lachnospiraceae bacterium PF1-21]|uniref:dTTP/UTP pyrophosphatase n=1 Tax=Ohessyouella blattaphilus TaxID=2949333 RepID=A0ABT1EKL8_9FIRM|nr:Maf family protein [Ohessyouella blattaphilus]MCP1111243.1 Maf family protein [Ohessyouella blattaphilus]MCR8564637.1 Maf family protein [Ohessyouella blattaphilus]